MGRPILIRSQLHQVTARAVVRPVAAPRTITRTAPVRISERPAVSSFFSSSSSFQPEPYVDYERFLTPEGGVLIGFKDIDDRLRHTIWRILAWSICTGFEGWFVFKAVPLQNPWLNFGCLLAAAIVNWLIVAKPVETYRGLEIRPDCMIIDGSDVFWLQFMEGKRLEFLPDPQGNQVLCGVYGTRFVNYLTIRRFDELDRTPEVLAAHLCEAMKQLWEQTV